MYSSSVTVTNLNNTMRYETLHSRAGFLVFVNRLLYLFDFRLSSSSSIFAGLATGLMFVRVIRGFDLGCAAAFPRFFFEASFEFVLFKLRSSINSSSDFNEPKPLVLILLALVNLIRR